MKTMVIYFINGLEVGYEFKNLTINCGVGETTYISFIGRRRSDEDYRQILIPFSRIEWIDYAE